MLLSGHHANIRKWRLERAMEITLQKRPDILKPEEMSKEEKKIFKKVQEKILEKTLANQEEL